MTYNTRRIIGIDPGLRHTGWGVIEMTGSSLSYLGCGRISPSSDTTSDRLLYIAQQLRQVVSLYQPHDSAVEHTFVNRNPKSSLTLGQARGVALLILAEAKLPCAEYAPNLVKKAVVGNGHAEKHQVSAMVRVLLPASRVSSHDAADALSVAICHANHSGRNSIAHRVRTSSVAVSPTEIS